MYSRDVSEGSRRAQRHIALILAKDLAASVASAILLVDADGDLVFYNEAAERILARTYAEAQMSSADLARAFKPVDETGKPIPLEELPLATAFRQSVPAHGHLRIEAADGTPHELEVVAVPLFARVGELVGGMAVFWERVEGG